MYENDILDLRNGAEKSIKEDEIEYEEIPIIGPTFMDPVMLFRFKENNYWLSAWKTKTTFMIYRPSLWNHKLD